jgi:hypothetical protein
MTLSGDHPDWQDYTNWRGPTFATAFDYPLSSTNPYSEGTYVTNYQALVINIAGNPAAGLTVVVSYYIDATQAIFQGEQTWNVPTNTALFCMVPVLGNYAVVQVTTTTAAVTDTTIVVTPSNTPCPSIRYNAENNYIAGNTVSIGASSTDIFPLPYVSEGPASIFFRDQTATGKFDVYIILLSQTGGAGQYIYIEGGANALQFQFIAPRGAIGLRITNTDTAAHNVDYYLAVDGR